MKIPESALEYNRKVEEAYARFTQESLKRELDKMESLGPYDPKSDTRNMCREAIEELYDVCSYMRFLGRKHPTLADAAQTITDDAFEIFFDLERLALLETSRSEGEINEGTAEGD